jgi:hypothetical protein
MFSSSSDGYRRLRSLRNVKTADRLGHRRQSQAFGEVWQQLPRVHPTI